MTSNLRAGRRGWETDPLANRSDDVGVDADLESEIAEVATWFDTLPLDLRAHLDREARAGREAYVWP